MVEDALDDFCSDSLALIGLIDDDVPNGGPVDEVREHSSESDQSFTVPCAQRQIGMLEHLFSVFKRPLFGPRSLMEQA